MTPNRHLPLLIGIAVVLALASSGVAQEWTRFRGPNGSGVNAQIQLPPSWQEKDFRWKIDLPGGGHSSPVIWGKQLYLTVADDETGNRMLLSFSIAGGKTLWKANFPSHTFHQHQDNSYASSTPAVDELGVYLCWNTPEEFSVYGFDHDGKQLWKTELGPFISQHGGGNSPIVVGNIVLIGDDQEGRQSYLFGIDRTNGHIVWKLPRTSVKFSGSTPSLLQQDTHSPLAIFTSLGEGVTAINPETGTVAWAMARAFDARTISSPVVADGLIFATCGEGTNGHGVLATRPPTAGQTAPALAYKIPSPSPYVPTPIVNNGLLFAITDTGWLSCYHATDGHELWRHRIGGSYYSSPVIAGDTLFVTSKRGTVHAYAAADQFRELGQTELGEKCHATPALAAGCLFARTYTHLLCVIGHPVK